MILMADTVISLRNVSLEVGTCRYIDVGTCRFIDVGTCRYIDVGTCRYIDVSTCRYSDVGTCRYIDVSICRYIDVGTCRYSDVGTCRYNDVGTCRYIDIGTCRYMLQTLEGKGMFKRIDSFSQSKRFSPSRIFRSKYQLQFFALNCISSRIESVCIDFDVDDDRFFDFSFDFSHALECHPFPGIEGAF